MQELYKDFLKAPIFNALLFFVVLSTQIGRAPFYIFATLTICYFFANVFSNFREEKDRLISLIVRTKKIAFSFLAILGIMTLSNITNDYSNLVAWSYEVKFFLKVPLFILLLAYFFNKSYFSLELLYGFILIAILIQVTSGIFQAISGYDFVNSKEFHLCTGLTGLTSNRNTFGFLIGFGLLAFVEMAFSKLQLHWRALSFAAVSVILFCVLFSMGRGTWIAIFACLAFYSIYSLLIKDYKKCSFSIFLFIVMLISITSLECLTTRTEALVTGNTSGRVIAWGSIIELISQKPLLGWGMEKIGRFGNFSGHPHNIFLEIILYTGFTGLLAFFVCICLIMREMYIEKLAFLFSILLYITIKGSVSLTLFSGNRLTFCIALLIFMVISSNIKPPKEQS